MSTRSTPNHYVWETDTVPDGQVLAAVRRGLGRDAGTVPSLWGHYRNLTPSGRISPWLTAEHLAMGLYGLHQQSQRFCVHASGERLGNAVQRLHKRFSVDAVNTRFGAAATAPSAAGAAYHLRGLITQMRSLDRVPSIDYTQLVSDLRAIDLGGDEATATRLHWAAAYLHDPAKSVPLAKGDPPAQS